MNKWNDKKNHVINRINWKVKLIIIFSIWSSESYLIFNYKKNLFHFVFAFNFSTIHNFWWSQWRNVFSNFWNKNVMNSKINNRDAYDLQPRWLRKMSIVFIKIDMSLKWLLLTPQVSRNTGRRVLYKKTKWNFQLQIKNSKR